jgi:hypothetical protein
MKSLKRINYDCTSCGEPLEINQRAAGKEKPCPACNKPVMVPDVGKGDQTAPGKKSVKVRMNIGGVGGIDTEVSKRAAEGIAYTVVGALVVLIGIIFGMKLPPRK